MSTRAVIARVSGNEGEFKGVYSHWEGELVKARLDAEMASKARKAGGCGRTFLTRDTRAEIRHLA